jgi:hypothetical protein
MGASLQVSIFGPLGLAIPTFDDDMTTATQYEKQTVHFDNEKRAITNPQIQAKYNTKKHSK